MTTEELKLAKEGRYYWLEYVKINGYAFTPTEEGLSKLSKLLDLEKKYVKKCINLYLEA